jgi:hypothetical protein
LEEWGPPMEKVVYLILSREKDSFNIIYAGNCEQTVDKEFFTKNSSLNCWIEKSGSKKLLYLAILPLFESENDERKKILDKIIVRYNPVCNLETMSNVKQCPIPTKDNLQNNYNSIPQKISCPCCGSKMKTDKILENTIIIRCTECGLSDTTINP